MLLHGNNFPIIRRILSMRAIHEQRAAHARGMAAQRHFSYQIANIKLNHLSTINKHHRVRWDLGLSYNWIIISAVQKLTLDCNLDHTHTHSYNGGYLFSERSSRVGSRGLNPAALQLIIPVRCGEISYRPLQFRAPFFAITRRKYDCGRVFCNQ